MSNRSDMERRPSMVIPELRAERVRNLDPEREGEVNKLNDRWSHFVGFKTLVLSQIVSSTNFWRFTYVRERYPGWPVFLVYTAFSFLIAYPMQYLELAIGTISQKKVLACWDIAPAGRGIGWTMLLICMFTTFTQSVLCAYYLSLFMHSFHTFLPWLDCAKSTEYPCAGRHSFDAGAMDLPAESFIYSYILKMKRTGIADGLGSLVFELSLYYIVSWFLIFFVSSRGMYSYSKMTWVTGIKFFLILVLAIFSAYSLYGNMFLLKMDTDQLFKVETYRALAEQVLMEQSIGHGTNIMFGAYNKEEKNLGPITVRSFAVCKIITLVSTIIVAKTLGAMNHDYDLEDKARPSGPATPMTVWADLLVRMPGNQFWSAFGFFTFFVVCIVATALLIQTVVSNLKGSVAQHYRGMLTVLLCIFYCAIGLVTLCTQGGVYVVAFLDYWPSSMPRLPVAALTAMVITHFYGVRSFCEDIYTVSKERPSLFIRTSWMISPYVLSVLFLAGQLFSNPPIVYQTPFSRHLKMGGSLLVLLILTPMAVMFAIYLIFRCRTRGIVTNAKK